MPPKAKSPRTKSPKSAKKGGGAEASWESSITSTSIYQDNWSTFVCFLTPDQAINQLYVDLIEKAMQNAVRRRFDLISKRDLVESIKLLGKPTKNASKSVSTSPTLASLTSSTFFPAYEFAKTILDGGGELDDHLWAKIIKCRMLDLKKEVQTRTAKKSAAKPAAAAPGKGEKPKSPGGKKSPKPATGAAAAAKKQSPAGQLTAAETQIEKTTGVKTRDQIIDETKYLDDEPVDGPNQYIYLSGFYSLGLLTGLDSLDIRIDTVTNISCDNAEQTKRLNEEMIQRDRQEQTLKADVMKDPNKDSILTPEQIAEQNERNDQILRQFWIQLMSTLDNAPDQSMLQDVIVTDLKVTNDEVPDSWVNIDQRMKLAQSLQENVVENSFRMNVRKRQFNSFNQQMKVVNVPSIEEKTIESAADAKTYQQITTSIPPESISVPLILHGILEQVEAQVNNQATNTSNNQDDIGQYLREKLMSLSMGRDQKKEIENLVPKSPFSKSSGTGMTMIYHGDDIKQRLSTLNRLTALDPIKIERDIIMSHSQLVNLPELSSKKRHPSINQERQTRLNQFLQCCTDDQLLPSDADHILKQFVFECMSLNARASDEAKTNEQIPSRPSSAGSDHADEPIDFARRLSNLNEEELKTATNSQPIIWDDPFDSMSINEQTGRIGLSGQTHASSSTSRSSRGSILRTRTQSPKRSEQDSVYTVRFDVNNPDNNLYQQMAHLVPPSTTYNIDGTIQNIRQFHKRNLNDWNFAEHFEPDVFVQIIQQAMFTHSSVDVYYNRRDNTHMLVLSLPVPEGKSVGHENMSKKLFSDVGFRNFLDEISNEIVDWLRDEEAKYQAEILANEVQVYAREASPQPETLKVPEIGGKKAKGATGKKTPPARSPTVSSDSGNSTDEEKNIRDDYVHPNSLKAWKQKKDKEQQELEQQQAVKVKRPPSGTKGGKPKSPKGDKTGTATAVKPPTPREKSPKRVKSPKRPSSAAPSEKSVGAKSAIDPNDVGDRFIGYSLGNRLLSAQCSTSHLLLPDGCLIRTRKDSLKRGATCVSTSLYRNKSLYTIQLVNPKTTAAAENEQTMASMDTTRTDDTTSRNNLTEPSTIESNKKHVAEFGVFTAVLNSGMIVSSSNYDTQPPKVEQPPVEAPPVVEAPVEEKTDDKKKDPKNKKKGKQVEVEAPPVVAEPTSEEKPPAEPVYQANPFQRLTVSIPTGLVVTYHPETYLGVKPTQENQPHRLVVKQYYACQSKGFHTCEQSRLNAYEESSRLVDGDGHVMIFKRNGEVTVFEPDGGIFMKTLIHQPDKDAEANWDAGATGKKDGKHESKGKKKEGKADADSSIVINEEPKPPMYQWTSITADGQVFQQNANQEYEKVNQLRLILETNPKTNEQVIHREDKVIIVFRSDGSRVVSFADGTRITMYEAVDNKNQSPSDRETGERNNSMLSFRKIPHVKVEALGYATVAFNCQTTDCRTVFNDGSSIDVFANGTYSIFECDGEKFDINENGDILFDFQQSIFGKRVQELLSNIEPSKCIMCQNGDLIFDAVDYQQTQYCVEASGETYLREHGQKESHPTTPLEMHMPRFFIVHEDGSGTELLRFKDLYSYLRTMDLDPGTAVVREPLLSNPKVTGATVMRPFQDEVHRRWLNTFDDESIVPQSLRNYTSATAMTRSYSSISASNQSSTNNLNGHDQAILRPNGKTDQQQFQSNTMTSGVSAQPPLLEMPRALDYRNFMEFPRLQDDVRMKMLNALKSYMEYVKERADYHTRILPHDNRNRAEKERANQIWKHLRPRGNTKDDLALLYLKTAYPKRQNPKEITRQSVIPLAKKFNLDHVHDELRREKANKQLKVTLSKGMAVPYFQSEWGMAYTQQQQQNSDRRVEMPSISATKGPAAMSPSNRPETPSRLPQNSPIDPQRFSQNRQSYLTRSASTEVEENQTVGDSMQRDLDNTYRPVKQPTPRTHLKYDAMGKERAHPINLPSGLKGTRPNAQPNARFLDMEEPAMVRPNNASIGTAALNNRPLRERRGCELYPERIDFGILKEGVTYGTEIEIKNVGIDACRFRIRQPPLGTGLRVIFQPGLLAAGMRRPITIELYAIIKQNQQNQDLYQLEQSIEIITETDIMHFPVRAKIATEEQFDSMFVNKDETAGMTKSVLLLARKTSNTNDWLNTANDNFLPTNDD